MQTKNVRYRTFFYNSDIIADANMKFVNAILTYIPFYLSQWNKPRQIAFYAYIK